MFWNKNALAMYEDFELTNLGIGGMAAALTLGLRGHRITILESAPKVRALFLFKTKVIIDLDSFSRSVPGSKSRQTC